MAGNVSSRRCPWADLRCLPGLPLWWTAGKSASDLEGCRTVSGFTAYEQQVRSW